MSTLNLKFLPRLIIFFDKTKSCSLPSRDVLGDQTLYKAAQAYFDKIMDNQCNSRDTASFMLAVEGDSLEYQIIELTDCENNEPKA